MENDREFEQVLMNVRNTSGGISSAIMLSARMSMLLVWSNYMYRKKIGLRNCLNMKQLELYLMKKVTKDGKPCTVAKF